MAGFHLRCCIGWFGVCLFLLGTDDSRRRPSSMNSSREAIYGSDQTWIDTEGFEAVG